MYIILGYGVTGIAVQHFLEQHGENYYIYDSQAISTPELQKYIIHSPPYNNANIKGIVLSPGISTQYNVNVQKPEWQFIEYARNNQIPIISDIQLFIEFYPNKQYIALTGTNGKSTTATLVYEICKQAEINASLSGNIGVSPCKNAINSQVCILEISSFQIEITNNIQFELSTIINITPDHLARYKTLEEYTKTKLKIINLSKNCIINHNIPHSNPNTIEFSTTKECQGYSLQKNKILFCNEEIASLPPTYIPHENILSAFGICHQFGIDPTIIINTISQFKGIEHRLEFVTEIDGVKFYNDSKATNIHSTHNALKTLKGHNIFLIAGGKLEDEITDIFSVPEFHNIQMIGLIGSASGTISKELITHNTKSSKKIKYCLYGNIEKALPLLFQEAKKLENAVIILSPFCKSFDQFQNFIERGLAFKKYTLALKE